ncbi:ABC transporter substrate-binding protein [Novispirillum sp. DQ9]|uniref:ABC transporter substrate-binding protein n=1 Tax=Novispirillum sp. DQ9 TaxID=3398612 RepID=UPI003C7C01F8
MQNHTPTKERQDARPGEKVVLHLRWIPQFQFAGYYAALWKGYYSEAGLDVEIRAPKEVGGPPDSSIKAVTEGTAEFGVGSADILLARDQGHDLVVLMSIFQSSPSALFVRRDVPFRSLADLTRMKVARLPADASDIEVRAMLLAQEVDPQAVLPAESIETPFDALIGNVVAAPFLLERLGIDTLMVRPRDYGVNFYGDSLFTTADLIRRRPGLVEAFVRATRRGWDYALRHPHEIARGLAGQFPSAAADLDPLAFNRAQIDPVLELTGHPVVEPGHVSADRWQGMNETLLRLGLVSSQLDTTSFLYPEVRVEAERQESLRRTFLGLLAVVGVLAFSGAVGALTMREVLRRRARALARSEESYRLLVDNLRDYAILALDADGRVTSWNRGAERLTGFSRDEVIGQHVSILFPVSDVESGLPQREIEQAHQFGRIEVEGMRARRDGTPFWANVVLSALRGTEGEILGYAVVLRDASQRKAQEDRIRFQATLLNRVRSAVIAVNDEGRVAYMNAYAEALFLLPWREAENRPLRELGLLPEDALTPLALRERAEQEVTARRTDGQSFPALLLASVAPDPEGRAHSALYVIHDLTERKRMEATLQHSSNLALLGRMSASLVHEISQPMNVIRLTAEGGLLRLASNRAEPEDLAHRFRTVSEQAARLFDTIDFMQTFSRRDAGRVDGAAGPPFDVAEAVRKAAEMMVERFEAAGIGLEIDLPAGVYTARGRTRQFEQVLLNLMGNALHALRLRGDQANRLVRVRLVPPAVVPGSLTLSVEDNGPGIPQSLRDQVFEPFFTTKPPGQGTGLGLSISLGIIRSMDGSMTVGESADLRGASFVISLPADHVAPEGAAADAGSAKTGTETLVVAAPPRPTAEPTSPPPAAALPHVLVVDDEELARREVVDYLSARGYRVSEASGGIEALEIVARCNGDADGNDGDGPAADGPPPIDAVITDIRMPRGNGTELIGHLADDYPQVFTIVMTGQPLHDREDLESIGSGADHVLRKPVSLGEIDAKLRQLLEDQGQEP